MRRITKTERSWVLYDWANSVHSTIISTAIFPLWFGQTAARAGQSDVQSTFWLGLGNSGYALILAFLAPILGTLSDFQGYRGRLFRFFFFLGIFSCGALIFLGPQAWQAALLLYMGSFIGFAGSNIFYDASLPDVTTPQRVDMISSMGFAYGYIGGSTIPFVGCLALIFFLSRGDLSGDLPSLGVKITFGITVLWWLVFTLPYFKNVKQKGGLPPGSRPVAASFRRLGLTLKNIKNHRPAFIFLLAYFFYIDGVVTIIKMAIDFGAKVGISSTILLVDLVGIQALAFPFTLLYGWLAKRFGSRFMLFAGIGVYMLITLLGFFLPFLGESAVIPVFLIISFLVASSQGGIQGLSRSYFVSLIPQDSPGEYFGFYNIFGKFAAIMGPLLMGGLPLLAVKLGFQEGRGAYSFGVGGIFLLFVLGGWLLMAVDKKEENHG